MPPLTPEATQLVAAAAAHQLEHPFDGPEDLSTGDRCLSGTGIPMLPYAYNNTYHIVQSHDFIGIVAEVMHDQRMIAVDGRPHGNVRRWLGDSVGRYEGDTLVVDTIGFNDKSWLHPAMQPHTEEAHLIERFRQVSAGGSNFLELAATVEVAGRVRDRDE